MGNDLQGRQTSWHEVTVDRYLRAVQAGDVLAESELRPSFVQAAPIYALEHWVSLRVWARLDLSQSVMSAVEVGMHDLGIGALTQPLASRGTTAGEVDSGATTETLLPGPPTRRAESV